MVLIQRRPFFQLLFLGNIGQQNAFMMLWKEKTPVQAIKTKSSKIRNIGHFSTFFLCNVGPKNVFNDILGRKNGFLGCKNQKFKKSKN